RYVRHLSYIQHDARNIKIAHYDRNEQFFHINFSPNNDPAKATVRFAVLLRSSSIGFTSTNSAEVTMSASDNISNAKWLSRYVNPPTTGVPTPGESFGSMPSKSKLTCTPSVRFFK